MLKVGDRVTLKHQPGRWLIVVKISNEDDLALLRFDAVDINGKTYTGITLASIDEHQPV
ncbi:hypothetical protein [Pantoea ananatis]|uniref:hypothetical protein n=1 Tax=Pantoea ananas TaxID=553 RepID=UPI0003F75202|nr:hypothetical protein [Pantoea ananatis]